MPFYITDAHARARPGAATAARASATRAARSSGRPGHARVRSAGKSIRKLRILGDRERERVSDRRGDRDRERQWLVSMYWFVVGYIANVYAYV